MNPSLHQKSKAELPDITKKLKSKKKNMKWLKDLWARLILKSISCLSEIQITDNTICLFIPCQLFQKGI
jgi:hypothetical protein